MLELSTTMYMIIGTVTFFGAIALLLVTVSGSVLERRAVYRSLRTVRSIELESRDEIHKRNVAAPASSRLFVPLFQRAARLARRFTPAATVERLEEELAHAGSPPNWDAGRVLAFKVITPPLLVVGFVLFGGPVLALNAIQLLIGGLLVGFVGWYLPEWVVRSKAGARQHQILLDLPDALDLLSITVEAGLGFDSALARVSREVKGPLGQELYRVVQEVQLGEDRIQALRNLGDRNTVPELRSFVLAMIQADILGIAVSNVLQVQAREARMKRRQRAEERAQKLPVKIVFPLIFCIFPALFVVLLGPAIIQIWESIFQVF